MVQLKSIDKNIINIIILLIQLSDSFQMYSGNTGFGVKNTFETP